MARQWMMAAILSMLWAGSAVAGEEAAVAGRLNATISCDYEDLSLEGMVADIRQKTGIDNILIDKEARRIAEEWGDGSGITMKLTEVSAKTVLREALKPRGLTAVVRHGVVVVTTLEGVKRAPAVRMYGIQELLMAIRDFQSPQVDLLPPDTSIEKRGKDVFLGRLTSTEKESPLNDADVIVEIIKQSVKGGEAAWEETGSGIEVKGGNLVVTAPESLHEEVSRMIAMLRQFK